MPMHSAVRAYLHLHCSAREGCVALVGLDGPIAFYVLLRSEGVGAIWRRKCYTGPQVIELILVAKSKYASRFAERGR